jgi:ribosomal protein S12 methylthiotransferase
VSSAYKTHSRRPSVAFVSLGCPKNLVDSEIMIAHLARSGFDLKGSVGEADVAVLNTCSFLASARREAEQWVEHALDLKKAGRLKAVVVAGCLPALAGERLFDTYPGIDAIVGPRDRLRLARACTSALESRSCERSFLTGTDALVRAVYPRAVSTGAHSAYLKISEGCDNRCGYCLIPKIRGPLVSRAAGSVMREANLLAANGVRELCVVAQDTTAYGIDLYGKPSLPGLLSRLASVEGIAWVRLLYTHPAHWSPELIEVLRENPNLCKYADVPIQHVSDRMLRLMGRRVGQKRLLDTLTEIRNAVPGISLRTTVMVGFPGESEADFDELLQFLRGFEFEHLGVFAFSCEQGTRAASMPGQVEDEIKEQRCKRVMEAQRNISRKKNASFIGKRVSVLLDRVEAGGIRGTGRTEGQAPEVDSVVSLAGVDLREGSFQEVKITGSRDYELIGQAIGSRKRPAPLTRRRSK